MADGNGFKGQNVMYYEPRVNLIRPSGTSA